MNDTTPVPGCSCVCCKDTQRQRLRNEAIHETITALLGGTTKDA